MSFNQNNQVLPAKITDKMVAGMVSNALRIEHTYSSAVVKRIGRLTGASLHSVTKWYQGLNAPKSGHLLMLARVYPNVLRVILEMIDKREVWEVCEQMLLRDRKASLFHNQLLEEEIYRVKFVPINVVVDSKIIPNLNQRQLWFLGRLQVGVSLKALDIQTVWQVSEKTAKRDISNLVKAKLIKFLGAKRNGYYALRKP